MDFLDELEEMAAGMTLNEQDLEAQVRRFQDLFHYSSSTAKDIIESRRADVSRKTVSDAHWQMVQQQKEAEGYDREAYEYAIEAGLICRQNHINERQQELDIHDLRAKYLIELKGPIDCARTIQNLAGTLKAPTTVRGTGSSKEAFFCLIDGRVKRAILSHLGSNGPRLTFIRINMADKDLSDCCIAPVIGSDIEPTLPQHRAHNADHTFLPAQDQYPVWYFFYGTLAIPEVLATKLSLSETPVLRQATIRGGVIQMWRGKYKALVDGPATAEVDGWAYELVSKEHEEQLRYYETDRYEVVRCDILMRNSGGSVKGLTFRFIGSTQD
jgi:Gamma-glutamyl cyclotransferase, AIG2-like